MMRSFYIATAMLAAGAAPIVATNVSSQPIESKLLVAQTVAEITDAYFGLCKAETPESRAYHERRLSMLVQEYRDETGRDFTVPPC